MTNSTVIDCPQCSVRVKTDIKYWVGNAESDAYFLAECPSCKQALLGKAFVYQDEQMNYEWSNAERIWPVPANTEISSSIPVAARRDIKDAQKCLSHGIYSAAAVLCGKALERLIHEKAGANMMIGKGLAELKTKGIIDERLFTWAEALRKERNIGAHASEQETTRENAEDVIDFTIAIFDYVYTLSEKYDKYLARKAMPHGLPG
ncbi:DUF4145 domain-containing protein [Rhodoferax saidenbachensis]|uniref:DUF4145 domain-containing protein n=1 Tax=Rhodoferax saidenbachensis TaxID=1484693 RepID=A0A1P8KAK6_9BURK|nr:DUF4145 domain-containing protein [Rhodoferax saidenbachensis]APW43044.1 hypothetical protein RS694_11215 [Rhodoferax saidenbachensis]